MNGTADPLTEVTAFYRQRREQLIREAREDERSHRPLTASHKRHCARLMSMYILSEQINNQPTGLPKHD